MGKVTVPMGPAPLHNPALGPRTFVPLQDILVSLEVLLLLHVHVGGGGQVPRHAVVRGLAAPVGPRPGWRRQQPRAGGSARWQARGGVPQEGFGGRRGVARGGQPPDPAPRATALRRSALPRRDAPRFCGISGLRRRRPPGRRSGRAGLRHRPPARPPPAAGPSAVSIWDPQQVPGNKAPGPVPTEGAGGSPPREGEQWTMLEVLSPTHLRASEDQATIRGQGGGQTRVQETPRPGGLWRWQGASGPDSAARVRAAEDQAAAPPFCPPEPASASAAALGGTVHSPWPRLLSPPSFLLLFTAHITSIR